jgi:hypothetical protein
MWTIAGYSALGLVLWVVVDILRAVRFARWANTVGKLPPGRFCSVSKCLLLRMARREYAAPGLPDWFSPCRLEQIIVRNDRIVALFQCDRQSVMKGLPIENDADVMDLFVRVTRSTAGEWEGLSESYRQTLLATLAIPSPLLHDS